jgi:hypothetical protein
MANARAKEYEMLAELERQVDGLSREEMYLVQQYTHHGDIIMNAYMRQQDTYDTYNNNIFNPEVDDTDVYAFFCLYLLEVDPNALSDPAHFGEHMVMSGQGLISDQTFRNYYANQIYPTFSFDNFNAMSLTRLKIHTTAVIRKLVNILAKRPPTRKFLVSYRGTSSKYLLRQTEPLTLGSFHSTSLFESVARKFGDHIYKFMINPYCNYMYIEPLTIHHGEQEILLGPGNRYVRVPDTFLKKIKEPYDVFLILPPRPSKLNMRAKRVAAKLLKKLAAENAVANTNANTRGNKTPNVSQIIETMMNNTKFQQQLNDFYGAAAGGGGAEGTAGRGGATNGEKIVLNLLSDPTYQAQLNAFYKMEGQQQKGGKAKRIGTRKRKIQRARKTRKQRGGVGVNVELDPMNRWVADPIFTPAGDLDDDDLRMIQEMLTHLQNEK